MTTTIRRLALPLVAALALLAPTAACGTGHDNDVYEPAAWGPTVGGQTYCGYVYTPLECAGHPGVPMQLPQARPDAGDLLATALWIHLLTYPSYYHSGFYYDRYIAHSHTTVVVNRTTYVNQGRTFDRTYTGQERTYDSHAKYRGPGGRTYTGNKYGSLTKSNNVTVRKNSNTSGGGNAGTRGDPGKKTGPGGSKPKTGGGVTRKTGGGSRSGGFSGGRTGGRR